MGYRTPRELIDSVSRTLVCFRAARRILALFFRKLFFVFY